MHTDLSKAYELLGVKPGVPIRELKAAHRDLAKVWHPDRFVHDPRLQEKAQEKLKEINEAYDLISSGKIPRPAPSRPSPSQPPPSRPAETVYYSDQMARSAPREGSSKWVVVSVLLFLAVFAVTTKVLIDRRSQAVAPVEAEPVQVEASTRPESTARGEVTRKPNHEGPAPQDNSTSTPIEAPPSVPTPAVATVTVLIDPESGLRAKADCPVRSRMTYPSGSEPSGYCNINHAPPPKESKIKAIKDKILH